MSDQLADSTYNRQGRQDPKSALTSLLAAIIIIQTATPSQKWKPWRARKKRCFIH